MTCQYKETAMIRVFGHKAPDTDAIGSALIAEWYLSEVRRAPAQAFALGPPNTETAFVLRRWHLEPPEVLTDVASGDRCFIVDTNNPTELPPSIREAEIIGIVDHHLLAGGLTTRAPIEIAIRPVACSATILHDLIGSDMGRMPRDLKGVMLSCILSDTLAFRSPTTTPHDQAVAEALAAELGVAIPVYAVEMFAAKSDVAAFDEPTLLGMDSKAYPVGDRMLRVSVLETTTPELLLRRKAALMAAMPGVAAQGGADQLLLFIIDILKQEATLLVPNDLVARIAEASFGTRPTGDTLTLPGIVSRKKQIIPALTL